MIHALALLHLVAAAIWLGGLIGLAASVVALRKIGVERETLRAVARQFARLSWVAMAVAVITGFLRVHHLHISWSYGRLHLKIGLVALVIVTALVHQLTARTSSPAVRGVVQLAIIFLSLGIFAAAVTL